MASHIRPTKGPIRHSLHKWMHTHFKLATLRLQSSNPNHYTILLYSHCMVIWLHSHFTAEVLYICAVSLLAGKRIRKMNHMDTSLQLYVVLFYNALHMYMHSSEFFKYLKGTLFDWFWVAYAIYYSRMWGM